MIIPLAAGSPQHLAMALFASRADIKVTHIPYKGEVDVAPQELGIATKAQFEMYRKLLQDNNIKSD